MITVVVADDQQVVRAGFAALLATQPDITVLGTAADGTQAIRLCQQQHPDVILMDIRMPGTDGIEATRILRADAGHDAPRVLILTTFDLDEYVYDALAAGASGFLLKDADPEDLFQAVRIIAAGDALLAPAITRRLIADITRVRPRRTAKPDALKVLTAREKEVLRLIANGLSNKEIATQLVLSDETVKTHVSRILTKLQLRDRTQAVITAYETGLITPGDTR